MGTALGLTNQRIQFTPDLMPSDILGSEVLDEADGGQRRASGSSRGRSSPSC
jgi:MoxR-like ATPase